MKYKTGDKVVIVDKRAPGMNIRGCMDKWLGKTMTISSMTGSCYHMAECKDDRAKWHPWEWEWTDEMIDHEKTAALQCHYKDTEITFEEKDIKQSMENMLDKPKGKTMTKQDLQAGMLIKTRAGTVCIILSSGGIRGSVSPEYPLGIVRDIKISSYDDNLTHSDNKDYDIMEVRQVVGPHGHMSLEASWDYAEVLYKRDPEETTSHKGKTMTKEDTQKCTMYTFGEVIEVRDSDENAWVRRMYVGSTADGRVYVACQEDEEEFENGVPFTAVPYRLHQKRLETIKIGGVEVPAPMRHLPELGDEYWYPDALSEKGYSKTTYTEHAADDTVLCNNQAFSTEHAVQAFVLAMKDLLEGDNV